MYSLDFFGNMKCDNDSGSNMIINHHHHQQQNRCYVQEKKQLRKELFKWSKQITEYCAFESFIEYLLPNHKFKTFNKSYQDNCEILKEEGVFDCHDTAAIMDEELLLNDCNAKNDGVKQQTQQQQQQDYDEYDDGYYSFKENQLNDEPLDLSKKERMPMVFDSSSPFMPYGDPAFQFKLLYESGLLLNNCLNSVKTPATTSVPPPTTPPVQPVATPSSSTTAGSNRRSYSKEELDKALADIQSGRIGTRRASVLYGIPRSTLRNKVFRLNNQKTSQGATGKKKPAPVTAAQSTKNEPQSTKLNDLKSQLISSLSMNFAYDKLFPSNHQQQQQLQISEDLVEYAKSYNTLFSSPLQQYLGNAMLNILNEVVNKKLAPDEAPLQPVAKLKHANAVNNTNNERHHQHQLSLKQKRAKRGQYRKYESDQLNKAVDAVINGLMSVHKAGSHFGVPHSTLEYKVKERNVKGIPAAAPPTPAPTTSKKPENKKKQNNDSIDKNSFLPPPPPALPTDFFSASELLRKFYEGVQTP